MEPCRSRKHTNQLHDDNSRSSHSPQQGEEPRKAQHEQFESEGIHLSSPSEDIPTSSKFKTTTASLLGIDSELKAESCRPIWVSAAG
jgi:hypothetical protein